MNFKTATDLATQTCITLTDVGDAGGVAHDSVRKARLDPVSVSYRPPPDGWEAAIAHLARNRAEELVVLAEELEG